MCSGRDVVESGMGKSAIRVGKRSITVSNLDKVLYPGGRFNKASVIEYYSNIAPVLLPHFKNRPVTLVRYPDGVFKESFYEKNAPGFTPNWVKTFPVPRSEGGKINYILINDLPTLVWVANLAALELHPFLHRAPKIDTPTHVVFDLDPGEGVDILGCAEVAFMVKEVLEKLNLTAFAKVSGSKGIQIYVPLNRAVTYDQTSRFARTTAELLMREQPGRIVSEMAKSLRTGKVFIDWSQNNRSKTTVGVYSLRAKRERPFVSMPVEWDELKRAIASKKTERLFFSPQAALDRIREQGDLFAPVLKLKQRLPESFRDAVEEPSPAPKSLAEYAAKRQFSKTSEPVPELPRRSAQGSRRRYVIQKHAAQHLHYDLRLEMHDVLKSWAVPKGMPLRHGETRSAFATEDHPIEYLEFEGIIPKGQYGGGTVMVWDIGTYEKVEGNYYAGELKVYLTGHKCKGEWTLQRANRNRGKENAWLLIKTSGSAKKLAPKTEGLSALSRRSLEEIAHGNSVVWHSNREGQPLSQSDETATKKASETRSGRRRRTSISKQSKNRLQQPPDFVAPMKATLVQTLPGGPEWIYEVKWDGYRALGVKGGDQVRLLSLKNKDLTADFPSVAEAVQSVRANTALLDGEIVALNERGVPSFQALQNRASLSNDWTITYYAFDLLNLEGEDLRKLPLEQRKARLQEILEGSAVRFSANMPGKPAEIVEVVKRAGLEGIIAKQKDSTYIGGTRSRAWQKFKLAQSQEFVIGGYNPEGKTFSSLLVGYYEGESLMFAGKVRQGLNPPLRNSLRKEFTPLEIIECPFANLPTSKTGHFGEGITESDMIKLRWMRPKLVAQVSFTEWTSYGLLRHATFLGLREDKDPKEVVRESVGSVETK